MATAFAAASAAAPFPSWAPHTSAGSDSDSDFGDTGDVGYLEHNQRFQAAVLATMEKEVSAMEDQLLDRDASIELHGKAREDLGVALGSINGTVMNLKKTLKKSTSALAKVQSDRQVVATERDSLQATSIALELEVKKSKAEASQLRHELERARDEIVKRKEMHNVFSNNMLVQKSLKQATEREVGHQKDDVRAWQSEAATWEKKYHAAVTEAQAIKSDLEEQAGETKKAQAVVEKLVTEITLLTDTKNIIEGQWEAAQRAMQRRDAAMQQTAQESKAAGGKVKVLQMQERMLLQENEALVNANDVADDQILSMGEKLGTVNEDLREAKTDTRRLNKELSHAQSDNTRALTELEVASKQLEEVGKDRDAAREGLRAAESALTTTRQELVDIQTKLDFETRNNADHAKKQTAIFDAKTKQLTEEKDRIAHDRATQLNQNLHLKHALKSALVKQELTEGEFTGLLHTFDEVEKDNQSLENNLEHASYKANKWEQEFQLLKRNKQREMEDMEKKVKSELHALDKLFERKKAELKELEVQFVKTENHVSIGQKLVEQHQRQSSALQQELMMTTLQKDRVKAQLQVLDKEHTDRSLEVNHVRLDLRKITTQLNKEKSRNAELKKTVEDVRFRMEELQDGHQAEVVALKAAANRPSGKNQMMETLKAVDQERGQLDRKLEFLTIKYDQLKKEVIRYTKENFELRTHLQSSQKNASKKDQDYAKWQKQFETVFSKELKDRQVRRREEQRMNHPSKLLMATAPAGLSQGASPLGRRSKSGHGKGGSQTSRAMGDSKFLENLVHELRMQLNRVSTVAAERMNEIVQLKEVYKEMEEQTATAGDNSSELSIRLRQNKGQRKVLQRELMEARTRVTRTEALAASLEQQLQSIKHWVSKVTKLEMDEVLPDSLRDTAPHKDVDYGFYPDMEMSYKLNRCLNHPDLKADKRRKKRASRHSNDPLDDMDNFLKGLNLNDIGT